MSQSNLLLKIDGIPGESQDAEFKGAIELESFAYGMSNSGSFATGGGGGGGKVALQDAKLVMKANKASPKLFLACATGQHIEKAVVIVRKDGKGPQSYLVFELSNLFVTSYVSRGGRDVVPRDYLTLSYERIVVEYRPQKADGSLDAAHRGSWDQKANKPV